MFRLNFATEYHNYSSFLLKHKSSPLCLIPPDLKSGKIKNLQTFQRKAFQ